MNPTALTPDGHLPAKNRERDLDLLTFKAPGWLLGRQEALELPGSRERVVMTDIRRVSEGKQSRYFVMNRGKIVSGSAAAPATALFAEGILLGRAGVFGGTRHLLAALRDLAQGTPSAPLPPGGPP